MTLHIMPNAKHTNEVISAPTHTGIITTRKRSLGQGNVFTPVCHSVHRGLVYIGRGGVCIRGAWADPEIYMILRDKVNKRAVRTLLECILVITKHSLLLLRNRSRRCLLNYHSISHIALFFVLVRPITRSRLLPLNKLFLHDIGCALSTKYEVKLFDKRKY